MIKWCILGIIQGLVADPTVFIKHSEDTDIVLWDQVPKWVRAMPGTVMITECQKQQKQEGQKKRRLRGKQETSVETWEMHLQDHVSEIIKGPQGGSGSDKFRITTIMCQRIRHWFSEDKDPVGEIMPTVAIFFEAEGYLEDMGDDGTFCRGPHEGSKAPVQLMHEWRNLRKQGLLPGCQVSTAGLSEIYIWQQENAYLSALRAVRHRASAVVIELDFLELSSTSLEMLTFNNYHSGDSRDSGSRGIELSLKGTAVLY